MVKRILVF
jgi:hypothetical protein